MLKNKILSASGGEVDPIFVEQVFATHLYTGNGSTQTINNGIDLAGQGGLVWLKQRSGTATSHTISDTIRGTNKYVTSNSTNAETTFALLSSYNSNGFTIGQGTVQNASSQTYVSWTFRKQEKFFTCLTYTGTGVTRTISHDLGSTPGCIIVKRTDTTSNWQVYHRGLTSAANSIQLNLTNAEASATTVWNSTAPTSTVFSVGTDATVNASGGTYVAYLFAHDAGGFGATGNDNVISCGSFTTDGAGLVDVNLGYEPQWLLFKRTNEAGNDWFIVDTMRGWNVSGSTVELNPNNSGAEGSLGNLRPTATGFAFTSNLFGANVPFIYIAIRRPHKPPTSGTQVFAPVARTGTSTVVSVTSPNFAPDLLFSRDRNSGIGKFSFNDKLRGPGRSIYSTDTTTEAATTGLTSLDNLGYTVPSDGLSYNESGDSIITECLRRAPGFFDVVCYTGTGNGQVINHNLGAVPELAIFKLRTGTGGADWVVRAPGTVTDRFLLLNTTNAQSTAANWYSATSTQITFPTAYAGTASSGFTYVAYLFASMPGISQVGSYTGNGSSQTINCGFAAGARFVMIKRTDSTGDWYVWDTARGIVSGNDPRLSLNTTSAEVTTDDSIDPDSSGFIVNQLSATNINVNAANYIFLAIA